MKRLKYLMLVSMLVLMYSLTVYADNDKYGDGCIEVVIEVDDDLKGTIEFTLQNIQTGVKYSFSFSHVKGYKGRAYIGFGKYELIDYRILDENRNIVDGTMYLEDFEISVANPNGNWTWYLYPIVTYFKNDETSAKIDEKESTTEIYDILNNIYKEDEEDGTIDTLMIPADNSYFPNMTLEDIKIWYTREVNDFIANGGTTKNGRSYKLEDYQKSIENWAKWCFDKKKYSIEIEYNGSVEAYNVEQTQHFYEVQKKMYDFIKEYQEEHNVRLNFAKWDVVENETSSTTATTPTENSSSTVNETETTTADEATTISQEETSSSVNSNNVDKEDTSFWGKIKEMWLTILILIVAVVAGVVMKIKYSKSNE